jgi:4-hydroxybenzoate polyprenyltransferase
MQALDKYGKLMYLVRALRLEQWIKNFFIFLPVIFGGKLFEYPANLYAMVAFLLFSIAASSVYIINDILDVEEDRAHPAKRFRPVASGGLSKNEAYTVAALLAVTAIIAAFLFNELFGVLIVIYMFLNYLYSRLFKHEVIFDVFFIGAFFLLRIIAGSVVAGVQMSHWIIFMTVLLALFLGFNKRRQELLIFNQEGFKQRRVLANYNLYFIDQIISVLTASIVVVYMLYAVDLETMRRVGNKHLIYSIPFVYYGIFRYLYLIHKLKKEGDPIRILLADVRMQINLVIWLFVCISVIYFKF